MAYGISDGSCRCLPAGDVAGDGEEDARLTEEIDDERRDDAGNGADGERLATPASEDTQGMATGSGVFRSV